MSDIKVGIVGYGYWGPNLVRNFFEIPGAEIAMVSDLQAERLKAVQMRYPTIKTTTRYEDLLQNQELDAIVIATPVSTHYELAMQALKADKHVFVEKPLAANSNDGLQLIEVADKRNRVLIVDHTFIYTDAVKKMRDMVVSNELGDIYYYDSVRINLGLFQHDINVLWDLAVHDLAIMEYVLAKSPLAVSATGMSHIADEPENLAYLTLFFNDNLIAHLHVNWLAPLKVRQVLVGGSQKMIVFDDLEPSEKIKIYDKGITLEKNPENIRRLLIGYRAGDMWAPQLDRTEALRSEVLHFTDCINNKKTPITDGAAGLRVVQLLEAASISMANRGEPIELKLTNPLS